MLALIPGYAVYGKFIDNFLYCICATVLPINKLIAHVYPIFGLMVLVMALGVAGGMVFGGYGFYSILRLRLSLLAK